MAFPGSVLAPVPMARCTGRGLLDCFCGSRRLHLERISAGMQYRVLALRPAFGVQGNTATGWPGLHRR